MVRTLRVFIIMALLLSLSGCNDVYRPIPLISDTVNFDSGGVAVAVESNGKKHFAWSECYLLTCHIRYTNTISGSIGTIYEFNPVPNERWIQPALAVASDGNVYLAWKASNGSVYDICYRQIPGGVPDDYTCYDEGGEVWDATYDTPLVLTAKGNDVFLIYGAQYSPGTALLYRQVHGGTSGGYISDGLDSSRYHYYPSAAANGADAVYVSWQKIDPATPDAPQLCDNNNYGESGDMTHGQCSFIPAAYSQPALALDANLEWVYRVHMTDATPDVLRITYWEADNSGIYAYASADLSSETGWVLQGNPSVVSIGTDIHVAFSARNNSHLHNTEIYYLQYTHDDLSEPVPTRVSNQLTDDYIPWIGHVGLFPVIAWRTGIDYQDMYIYYGFPTDTVVQVFNSPTNSSGSEEMMLASDYYSIAAIWVDTLSNSDDRFVPWISFNTYATWAPVIVKP
jgi:hypothetical protein